jgi:hypothetical protein
VALRTSDARQTFARLRKLGLKPAEPVDFGRPVDTPDGEREARFTTTELDNDMTAGIRVFFCEHKTPDLVWLPRFLEQPNGVTGLAGLTVVDAGASFATAFERALGEASGALEYLGPAEASDRFAGDPILALAPPYVAAVRFRVRDRDATARFLRGSGVPTRNGPKGVLQVSSRDAMGAVLEFA